jgi:signal recognition particle subunit SRP54
VKQLETLGKQIDVPVHSPAQGASLTAHIQSAQARAKEDGARVVIYDTAGRLEVDEALLAELNGVVDAVQPQECLLVVDSATGQSAVAVAQAFQKSAPLTGLILSKFDGDAKGGSAFSVQSVTGAPVKFLGTGEQTNALEPFDPQRLVNRLLGMGDVVGLVEKAQEAIDVESAERMANKLKSNSLDLQDFLDQLRMMKKMGPLQNLLGNLPGMGSIADSALDERLLKQTEAMILSMTRQERRRPEVLNGRRRQRIALGSGTSVTQVNDLMKRFNASKKMMSKLTRGKGGNMEKKLQGLLSKLR